MNDREFYYSCKKGPNLISYDITNNCNLRCVHCYNESGECYDNQDLTDDEIRRVIQQIIDINPLTVCLCGGEPTLKLDILLDSISQMKKSNKVGTINMVSNGWFITRDVARKIKNAGLDMIQLSIDGFDSISHDNFRRVKGSFDRTISAIKNSIERGLEVSVSTIPHKLNYRDLNELVELCYKLGVSSFRSMPFIPMGRGEDANEWILSTDEYIIFIDDFMRLKDKYEKEGLALIWGDPLDHIKRMPNNLNMGVYSYQMCIKSNGDISVSPYFDFTVGNLKKEKLRNIWNKGYDKIWSNPIWLDYIKKIDGVKDFSSTKPVKIELGGDI